MEQALVCSGLPLFSSALCWRAWADWGGRGGGRRLRRFLSPSLSPAPPGAEPSSPRGSWAFSVSLGELRSIRRSKPGLSWAYLVLVTQAGGSLPALHFHRGGTRALLRVLSRYLLLAR